MPVRIGTVYNERLPNSNYRCAIPLQELERRGHEVLWPSETVKQDRIDRLVGCDVVHMHRQYGPATLAAVPLLARLGVAISYDNDDDLSAVPEESPYHSSFSGERGRNVQRAWQRIARRATLVTAPSEVLAEHHRQAGAQTVEVIENYLPPEFLVQDRRPHEGTVVGWIAGTTHAADAKRLGTALVLRRLLDEFPEVHVATIGLDLELGHTRYHRLERTRFSELLHSAAGFDIGIAPLADIPFNRSRSDVKLKEYGALGLPWLASPVGAYTRLGPAEGGELIGDDDWWEALIRLVTDPEERTRRGVLARRWAEQNTIATGVDRWEQAFAEAAERARRAAADWPA